MAGGGANGKYRPEEHILHAMEKREILAIKNTNK